MRQINILPRALRDIQHNADWYSAQANDRAFVESIARAVYRIAEKPKAYQEIEPDVRRCVVREFPFSIIFRHDTSSVVIVAVLHQHQEPNTWRR
jgi:toxin ParE1/3/4